MSSPIDALPDRADCIRAAECRSPHTCHSIGRCADAMTPAEEVKAFALASRDERVPRIAPAPGQPPAPRSRLCRCNHSETNHDHETGRCLARRGTSSGTVLPCSCRKFAQRIAT